MYRIEAELATTESIAPFGTLVGAAPGATQIMAFEGTTIFGAIPFRLEGTPELLVCDIAHREMRVGLMERHFHHTQTYLPLDGKPFVMVLAPDQDGDLPDMTTLRAFLFTDACGIALEHGVWHEFPFVLEDRGRIAVVLVSEAHENQAETPAFTDDADGPDLQRRSFLHRGIDVTVVVAEAP